MSAVYAKIIAYTFTTVFALSFLYNYRRYTIRKNFLNKECLKQYEEIIQEYNFSEQDDIERIAEKMGMQIKYTQTRKEAYIDKKHPNIIYVNDNLDTKKKNFAISHELGHVLRGYKKTAARAERRFFSALSTEEQICDYYSAAILLSASGMKKRLDEEGFDELRDDLQSEFIRKIAEEKNLMEDVVARRIVEVKKIYS